MVFMTYTRRVLECYTAILQYELLVHLSVQDFKIIYRRVDSTLTRFVNLV